MRQEEGYATVAVTALMSALSVLAIAYLEVGVAEVKKADAVAARLVTDAGMEGAVYEIAAKLLNGDIEHTYGQNSDLRYHGELYLIRIENEADKADINRAEIGDLREELFAAAWTSDARVTFLKEIETRRRGAVTAFLSMSDLVDPYRHPELYLCARSQFTVWHSSAVRSSADEDGSLSVSDGEVLRIRVSATPPAPVRTLDVTFLFTGRRDDPFFVLDWQRHDTQQKEACSQ